MANNWYDKGRQYVLEHHLTPASDTIKCALLKSAYSPNLATHQFYSDLGANVLNTPQAYTTKTTVSGTFDADDVTFAAVTAGDTGSYAATYVDIGGANTTWPLLWLFDTITGFPVATNGGDIIISWNASGIVRL